MNTQIGFFDESNCLRELSNLGDPLEKLDRVIDWALFVPLLNGVFAKERKGAGGRPPYPYLLMFKILLLQFLYNISDEQVEYQINDRLTFRRFLGLSLSDRIPDSRTIWLFRDHLVKAGVEKQLFGIFQDFLESKELITRRGSIVDATFVDVPRQRNSRDENKRIKQGETPEEWQQPENYRKLSQKDTDARWAKKNSETHYGYKNGIKIDEESKLIVDYVVTTANVHDSQHFEELIDVSKDNVIYADSAYASKEIEKNIMDKAKKLNRTIVMKVHVKGYNGKPLTDEQKLSNKEKSKTRCRVEHVFGFIVNSLRGSFLRSIGMVRATFGIGIVNLLYNMCRYEFNIRPVTVPVKK